MGYDRGDSFLFDFEPNGNPFGSKSKGKLSPRSYPIQCENKWKSSFLNVSGRPLIPYFSNFFKIIFLFIVSKALKKSINIPIAEEFLLRDT